MKKVAGVTALTLLLGGAMLHGTAARAQALPPPAPTCAVSSTEFSSWKTTAYAGGLAFSAPDSSAFQAAGFCSFYKWSAQMFLWLTSRDSTGNYVMFSPTFYQAVESTANGSFSYVQNTANVETGTTGLKKPKLKLTVRVNKPVLSLLRARELRAKGEDTGSTGQAGGGVLLVKGNPTPLPLKPGYATYPVVYYSIAVNDVYVGLANNTTTVPYYLTGSNAGNFPITLDQATQIQTAAKGSFTDLKQMALEVKNSWVDTAYLTADQAAGLLQIEGDVPAFTSSTVNGKLVLTWDGTTTATRTLALVGSHVVGTVAGHPEMVWSTFETNFNSPDTNYAYLNTNYNPSTLSCNPNTTCVTTVPFSTSASTPSIFYSGSTTQPPTTITETASSTGNNTTITSATATLVPTSVVRLNPWGNVQPATPSPANTTVINNTQLLSLKSSLSPQLGSTYFASYYQVGAQWTNGTIPTTSGAGEVGSTALANTSMETFQQTPAFSAGGPTGCFKCHGISAGDKGTAVSHVFNPSSN